MPTESNRCASDCPNLIPIENLTNEVDQLKRELHMLRQRVSPADVCECPAFCQWHRYARFVELSTDVGFLLHILENLDQSSLTPEERNRLSDISARAADREAGTTDV